MASRLVRRMRLPAEEALTAREIEVLMLVSKGASNAAVVVAALERGIIRLPGRTR